MPFTLAHPAAALPLARPLGRFGVPSALVIGSLAPDAGYFLPLPVPRGGTHGLPSLVLFCLPVGLAAYLAYHAVLKHPLAALAPRSVQARLAPVLGAPGALPAAPWSGVLLSLLAGAATHLAWDSFTHFGTPLVDAAPLLRARLFSVLGHPVFLVKLLQHLSTALGLALLAHWTRRWLRAAPRPAQPAPPPVPFAIRSGVLAASLALAAAVSLATAAPVASQAFSLWRIESAARSAAVSGVNAFGACLLVFAALWHARGLMRRSRG
jgi:hypothetical protein